METLPENSTIDFSNKKQELEQKLRILEVDMMNLDKRLEKEKQYFNHKVEMKSEASSVTTLFESLCTNRSINSCQYASKNGMGDGPTVNSTQLSETKHFRELSFPTFKEFQPKPEVAMSKPKLFFTWTSSIEDFRTKRIHKKLTEILETEPEDNLEKDQLAEKLITSLTEPFSKSSPTEDPGETISNYSDDNTQDCHFEEEDLLRDYREKLKQVEEKCLVGLASATEENADILTEIENYECCKSELGTNALEEVVNPLDERSTLNEDLILECFKDSDLTDYKSVPFSQVVKELETLESMVKSITDINLPPCTFDEDP